MPNSHLYNLETSTPPRDTSGFHRGAGSPGPPISGQLTLNTGTSDKNVCPRSEKFQQRIFRENVTMQLYFMFMHIPYAAHDICTKYGLFYKFPDTEKNWGYPPAPTSAADIGTKWLQLSWVKIGDKIDKISTTEERHFDNKTTQP